MISMKCIVLSGIVLLLVLGSGCLTPPEELNASIRTTDFQELNDSDGGGFVGAAVGELDLMSSEDHNKHDLDCTFCHTEQAIRPNCTDCHEGVHDSQLQNCTGCHQDEHAPTEDISNSDLEQFCSHCHSQQYEEFSVHNDRHADLRCVYCHLVHRRIESCTNCHAPHSVELMYEDCLNCHPAHMPQKLGYPEDTPNKQCAICHEDVNTALEQGNTKHSGLNCAYCHAVHELIPGCTECHTPHTEAMTDSYCMRCHPAHNPMDMELPTDTPREDCAACHKELDLELRGSDTKHDDLGCIYCHPKHRHLPTCESCHGLPHQEVFGDVHGEYPECAQCHIASHDVHNIVFSTSSS